jgi:hypothetical protein
MSENDRTPSEELKSLYREAAKRVHPDMAATEWERAQREERMSEVNLAYEAGDELTLRRILMETGGLPTAEESAAPTEAAWEAAWQAAQPSADEPTLFQSWQQPEAPPDVRIPHLGHLCLLSALAAFGFVFAVLLMLLALRFHLFGISSAAKAAFEVHYILGEEAVIYLATLAMSMLVFPLFWNKGFFAGLQWNGATAFHLRGRLFGAAGACFALAIVNGLLLPGPDDTPIDKIFRTPGAAWLLFVFGVTFAPFFEEILFRGFLLPALCTACDWMAEQATGRRPRLLNGNGHPRWSMPAMIVAARRADRPRPRPLPTAGGRQPGTLLDPPQHPLAGRQRPGPLQL